MRVLVACEFSGVVRDCFAKRGHESILKNIKEKKILPSLINEKNSRILDCKRRNLKEYRPIFVPDIEKNLNLKSSKILSGLFQLGGLILARCTLYCSSNNTGGYYNG